MKTLNKIIRYLFNDCWSSLLLFSFVRSFVNEYPMKLSQNKFIGYSHDVIYQHNKKLIEQCNIGINDIV